MAEETIQSLAWTIRYEESRTGAAGDQVFVLADPARHEPLPRQFTTAD